MFHKFHLLFISSQYSLGVKRDEMRKLEEIAQAEEKKLELAEQYLEEDAQMFDEFLKENDKNSVDAIKMYVGSYWRYSLKSKLTHLDLI